MLKSEYLRNVPLPEKLEKAEILPEKRGDCILTG